MKIKKTQLVFMILLNLLALQNKLLAITCTEDLCINNIYYDSYEKNKEISFKEIPLLKENQYFAYDDFLTFDNEIFTTPITLPVKRIMKIVDDSNDFYVSYEYVSVNIDHLENNIKKLIYNEIATFKIDKITNNQIITNYDYELIINDYRMHYYNIRGRGGEAKNISLYEKIQKYILDNNIDYAYFEKENKELFLKFDSIMFSPESFELDKESKIKLQKYLTLINLLEDKDLFITGYCADVGTEKAIERLSKERADEVNNFLKENGLLLESVMVIGKGKENPIASNHTREGRTLNRRTQIIVHF